MGTNKSLIHLVHPKIFETPGVYLIQSFYYYVNIGGKVLLFILIYFLFHFPAHAEIITDVKMPGEIDGMKLYNWIKEEKPHLKEKVIFMTGAFMPEVMGMNIPLITKPFLTDTYKKTVKDVLAGRRL